MAFKFDTATETILTDSGDLKINGAIILTQTNVVGSFPVAGDGLTLTGSPQTYAVDGTVIRTTGNQSIAGIKTFTDLPQIEDAPAGPQDATNKAYVDSVAAGLDPKQSVRAATTANITLSAPQTIDDVSVIAGDRVLVKNQSTLTQNGIYVVAAGAWSRSADMDGTPSNEVSGGNFTFVEEGTVNASTGWVLTGEGELTLGADDIVWVQFTGGSSFVEGDGIDISGNIIAVDATVVRTTRTVTAGAGLTGGGDLSANRTFDVGTASSARIVVNADNIDLATTAVTPGSYTNSNLTVDAYGRITTIASGDAGFEFVMIDNGDSPYTAVAGDELMIDVSGGAVTITLPASPSITDTPIYILHVLGDASVNNITIARNGNNIMGLAENMTISTNFASFGLVYSGNATAGWRLLFM